jgi:hypothetical protein
VLTAATTLAALAIPGTPAQAAGSVPAAHRSAAPAQALSWSVVTSRNPGSTSGPDELNAVSCLSATGCVAVGQSTSAKTSTSRTLIESWNGTAWSVVPSRNRGPSTTGNVLYGVSCVSSADCTAVGNYGKKTLIESWNGTTWSAVASPDGPSHNVLTGISCVSATSCMAVGFAGLKTLAESWNGTAWSIVPSRNPAPSGYASYLHGVSCVSASSCVAVGSYDDAGPADTLVESWDGSTWSVVPTPSLGSSTVNSLAGISCVSASSCMAVGNQEVPDDPNQTLAESWNGATWSVVPTPDTTVNDDNFLAGASCLTASDCTAVGWSDNSNGVGGATSTLIESWNGSAWSVVTSPNRASASLGNQLNGVSCVSASRCTAAGWYDSSHDFPRTLVELGTSG